MPFFNTVSRTVTALPKWLRCLIRSLVKPPDRDTFYVIGRHLYDHCGERTILRGINKMAIYDPIDPTCTSVFQEIAKTNANVVRIVWLTNESGHPAATIANLDQVIKNCRSNGMIPMIELHDATGHWNQLDSLVRFWTSDDVVTVLKTHEQYLLVNIGNEVGDYGVPDADFVKAYADAVKAIRSKGVRCPLVIDAAGYGQEMGYILNNGAALLSADPEKNLMFSLHVWWHGHTNAAADFENAVQSVVNANLPFVVGEFSGVCQYCDNVDNDGPYIEILDICEQNSIGWIAWEWGPGNEIVDSGSPTPPCPLMNMTVDGKFTGIQLGWPTSVLIDHPYSLKNRSRRPYSMTHMDKCECDDV